MSNWKDFNDVTDDQYGDLMPKGTLAKARMHIKPGGYDDPEQDWTGGYATCNPNTGSVYLHTEFIILEGPYAKRKVWHRIGLHSAKGPKWAEQGRIFIKNLLNSAYGLLPNDRSARAQQCQQINSFADLDGLVCAIRIGMADDQHGEEKNVVHIMITPRHKGYAAVMGHATSSASPLPTTTHTLSQATACPPLNTPHHKPDWS